MLSINSCHIQNGINETILTSPYIDETTSLFVLLIYKSDFLVYVVTDMMDLKMHGYSILCEIYILLMKITIH